MAAQTEPIVLIEHDTDDREFISHALEELDVPNPVRAFMSCEQALDYLYATREQPFLILCDIAFPGGGIDGLKLREVINADDYLRKKAIPFVFITDFASEASVRRAYDLTVQGFFVKANTMAGVVEQLRLLASYWRNCLHPNKNLFL